jgi:hypothetical protein
MTLTNDNYYSSEANKEYMSVSQYKMFRKCEAAAMAQIRGEWEYPTTAALLVGSYVDAWCEGTLREFQNHHPELYKKDGSLKSDFIQAEEIINVIKSDEKLLYYLSGKKQIIKTSELFGVPWKIKIDSYHPDKMIVDLKIMRSMERIMGKSFIEHWGYDIQMAIYSAVEGSELDTYLAVVTKQTPPDKDVIDIPEWKRKEVLSDVERNMPRIISVKSGIVEPERCGVCEYCRATKKIIEPIDFELVGLSAAERRAILGK